MTDEEREQAYNAGFDNGMKAMAQMVEGLMDEAMGYDEACESIEQMLKDFWGDE